MSELRIPVTDDVLAIIDAYGAANGLHREGVVGPLLSEWAEMKKRESIMILRVARINPLAQEPRGKEDGSR